MLWYLAKYGHRDVLPAEGFGRNGNNAAYTASDGMQAQSGAHYPALPSKDGVEAAKKILENAV